MCYHGAMLCPFTPSETCVLHVPFHLLHMLRSSQVFAPALAVSYIVTDTCPQFLTLFSWPSRSVSAEAIRWKDDHGLVSLQKRCHKRQDTTHTSHQYLSTSKIIKNNIWRKRSKKGVIWSPFSAWQSCNWYLSCCSWRCYARYRLMWTPYQTTT